MPTRIRSDGMSIAPVINQVVSTALAAIFLPIVSKYGYSTIFGDSPTDFVPVAANENRLVARGLETEWETSSGEICLPRMSLR